MSAVSYRLAEITDIDALVRLRLAFLAETAPQDAAIAALAEGIRDYFVKHVASGEFVACLALVDGAVVGVCGLIFQRFPPRLKNPVGRSGYILNVFVAPEFRRRGIASHLLMHIIERARQEHCKNVILHAMPGARELYPLFGFLPRESEFVLEL